MADDYLAQLCRGHCGVSFDENGEGLEHDDPVISRDPHIGAYRIQEISLQRQPGTLTTRSFYQVGAISPETVIAGRDFPSRFSGWRDSSAINKNNGAFGISESEADEDKSHGGSRWHLAQGIAGRLEGTHEKLISGGSVAGTRDERSQQIVSRMIVGRDSNDVDLSEKLVKYLSDLGGPLESPSPSKKRCHGQVQPPLQAPIPPVPGASSSVLGESQAAPPSSSQSNGSQYDRGIDKDHANIVGSGNVTNRTPHVTLSSVVEDTSPPPYCAGAFGSRASEPLNRSNIASGTLDFIGEADLEIGEELQLESALNSQLPSSDSPSSSSLAPLQPRSRSRRRPLVAPFPVMSGCTLTNRRSKRISHECDHLGVTGVIGGGGISGISPSGDPTGACWLRRDESVTSFYGQRVSESPGHEQMPALICQVVQRWLYRPHLAAGLEPSESIRSADSYVPPPSATSARRMGAGNPVGGGSATSAHPSRLGCGDVGRQSRLLTARSTIHKGAGAVGGCGCMERSASGCGLGSSVGGSNSGAGLLSGGAYEFRTARDLRLLAASIYVLSKMFCPGCGGAGGGPTNMSVVHASLRWALAAGIGNRPPSPATATAVFPLFLNGDFPNASQDSSGLSRWFEGRLSSGDGLGDIPLDSSGLDFDAPTIDWFDFTLDDPQSSGTDLDNSCPACRATATQTTLQAASMESRHTAVSVSNKRRTTGQSSSSAQETSTSASSHYLPQHNHPPRYPVGFPSLRVLPGHANSSFATSLATRVSPLGGISARIGHSESAYRLSAQSSFHSCASSAVGVAAGHSQGAYGSNDFLQTQHGITTNASACGSGGGGAGGSMMVSVTQALMIVLVFVYRLQYIESHRKWTQRATPSGQEPAGVSFASCLWTLAASLTVQNQIQQRLHESGHTKSPPPSSITSWCCSCPGFAMASNASVPKVGDLGKMCAAANGARDVLSRPVVTAVDAIRRAKHKTTVNGSAPSQASHCSIDMPLSDSSRIISRSSTPGSGNSQLVGPSETRIRSSLVQMCSKIFSDVRGLPRQAVQPIASRITSRLTNGSCSTSHRREDILQRPSRLTTATGVGSDPFCLRTTGTLTTAGGGIASAVAKQDQLSARLRTDNSLLTDAANSSCRCSAGTTKADSTSPPSLSLWDLPPLGRHQMMTRPQSVAIRDCAAVVEILQRFGVSLFMGSSWIDEQAPLSCTAIGHFLGRAFHTVEQARFCAVTASRHSNLATFPVSPGAPSASAGAAAGNPASPYPSQSGVGASAAGSAGGDGGIFGNAGGPRTRSLHFKKIAAAATTLYSSILPPAAAAAAAAATVSSPNGTAQGTTAHLAAPIGCALCRASLDRARRPSVQLQRSLGATSLDVERKVFSVMAIVDYQVRPNPTQLHSTLLGVFSLLPRRGFANLLPFACDPSVNIAVSTGPQDAICTSGIQPIGDGSSVLVVASLEGARDGNLYDGPSATAPADGPGIRKYSQTEGASGDDELLTPAKGTIRRLATTGRNGTPRMIGTHLPGGLHGIIPDTRTAPGEGDEATQNYFQRPVVSATTVTATDGTSTAIFSRTKGREGLTTGNTEEDGGGASAPSRPATEAAATSAVHMTVPDTAHVCSSDGVYELSPISTDEATAKSHIGPPPNNRGGARRHSGLVTDEGATSYCTLDSISHQSERASTQDMLEDDGTGSSPQGSDNRGFFMDAAIKSPSLSSKDDATYGSLSTTAQGDSPPLSVERSQFSPSGGGSAVVSLAAKSNRPAISETGRRNTTAAMLDTKTLAALGNSSGQNDDGSPCATGVPRRTWQRAAVAPVRLQKNVTAEIEWSLLQIDKRGEPDDMGSNEVEDIRKTGNRRKLRLRHGEDKIQHRREALLRALGQSRHPGTGGGTNAIAPRRYVIDGTEDEIAPLIEKASADFAVTSTVIELDPCKGDRRPEGEVLHGTFPSLAASKPLARTTVTATAATLISRYEGYVPPDIEAPTMSHHRSSSSFLASATVGLSSQVVAKRPANRIIEESIPDRFELIGNSRYLSRTQHNGGGRFHVPVGGAGQLIGVGPLRQGIGAVTSNGDRGTKHSRQSAGAGRSAA